MLVSELNRTIVHQIRISLLYNVTDVIVKRVKSVSENDELVGSCSHINHIFII